MVMGPDSVREMRVDEQPEVDALLRAAFLTGDEADLLLKLRSDGVMWAEFVLPWQGKVAAYAGISRMVAPVGWGCVAPVAVLPEFQNAALAPAPELAGQYRFGSRLMAWLPELVRLKASAQGADKDIPSTLVVVGKPSFYARAGFSQARAVRLISDYPLEYTLIARPGDDVPTERLIYPAAFAGL
ncbi:MAG: N-acetyltransferase [Pseudomonadota bacterium]